MDVSKNERIVGHICSREMQEGLAEVAADGHDPC
jgi:hypothetical protein